MRNWTALLAATAGLAVLAGCGSSKSNSTSNASATTTQAAASGYRGYGAPSPSTTTTAAATGGVQVVAMHTKLGTVLAAGPKRLTVYLFEADHGASSACSGACAAAWPPVTTSAAAVASGGASSAKLGTIARPNGSKQVTYGGHPLYFFVQDKQSGETTGQGLKAFGAAWYVLRPSGAKLDNS